jgi:beta-galactosidase GanA
MAGEFHPFRLPVPGLWLDIFQKIKAMGFTAVSFYVYWGVLEGNPGHIRDQGIFSLEQFFDAAEEAGIYLLARPGPYIQAETTGGGFPGWLAQVPAKIRSDFPGFLNATSLYSATIGAAIAKAQIPNGPVNFISQRTNTRQP